MPLIQIYCKHSFLTKNYKIKFINTIKLGFEVDSFPKVKNKNFCFKDIKEN